MQREKISEAVIRRLPRYYRHLEALSQSGVARISSQTLAENLNLTASQIRQDLNCFGGFGQQGYGYNVVSLYEQIGQILLGEQRHTAILLGVGNIGRALCQNFDFETCGISLAAAFDIDSALVGTRLGSVPVHHVDTLDAFVAERNPSLAILAVPRSEAVPTACKLRKLGLRGVWNFTNEDIHQYTEQMVVENIHFFDSLMVMRYHLKDIGPPGSDL